MKLKTLIASGLLTVTLFSCGNESSTPAPAPAAASTTNTNSKESEVDKNNNDNPKDDSQNTSSAVNPRYKYLLGSWKGNLRDKKLTVVIENIQGNIATGYNIAGSNRRPISGTIMEDDRDSGGECGGNQRAYKLILKEPGDDKWDGFFTVYFTDCPEMDDNQDKVIGHSYNAYGEWKAFSGKLSGDIYLSK